MPLQPKLAPKGKRLNFAGIHGDRSVELGQRVFSVARVKSQRSFGQQIVQIWVLHACPNRAQDFVAGYGVPALFVFRHSQEESWRAVGGRWFDAGRVIAL